MRRLVLLLALSSTLALYGCGDDLTMPATGTIYGDLVYEDGSPASGVEVLVEDLGLTATSDTQGRFIIGGVLAVDVEGMGKYYQVRGHVQRSGIHMGFIATHFKVKGQQSYSIGVVTVQQTGEIVGTMQLAGATDHSGAVIQVIGTSLLGLTRADGSYVIEHVPVHEGYEILCSKSGYHDMVIEESPDASPIAVGPGETVDLGADVLDAE